MSQIFGGFVGPSYQSADRYATVERTVNWHLAANEAPGEESKFRLALEPAPGNQPFGTLPVPAPFNQPNRGLLELRGRAFGVNGTKVFEITSTGDYILIGSVANDGKPCSMVANGTGQIFIASATHGYVIPKGALPGSLVEVPVDALNGPFFGASYATFQDGYIIVITPNSNQFQISGDDNTPLGDATIWSAANVSVQAGQADLLVAAISSREYLRLLGARRSQIYQDVGSSGIGAFPFQSYNETFIETGCAAPFSIVDMVESLMWIGEDARGQRACWRDTAFQPQRVSTFAVEQIWQSYVSVTDAVAFPYIWNGHLIYRITFPSAYESATRFPLGASQGAFTAATWEYDATVSALLGRPVWCERAYQTAMGYAVGRPELFHCYCYGKHLVGSGGADGNPGAIYQMGQAPTTNPNPQILLRWSNDGGNTWGVEQNIPIGVQGNYTQRIYWNRCGYARDRVFWLRYAEETECGTDITGAQSRQAVVRDRIAAHLWANNKRRIYNRFELESSRGIGASGAAGPFTFGIVNAILDVTECAS
jgi:hypothetical protein